MKTKLLNTLKYSAGQTIVSKGQKGTAILYIKSGTAKNIHSGMEYGDNKLFQFFGIISFLNDGVRTSTIVAETDVEVLEIDPSIFAEDESMHTLLHQLFKECTSIILKDENIIQEKDAEILSLQERIKELENK